jgi:hypothetical protein
MDQLGLMLEQEQELGPALVELVPVLQHLVLLLRSANLCQSI